MLDMEWLANSRIGLLNAENPVASLTVQRDLQNMGFSMFVTLRDYDYGISWGLPESGLRHYQCSFSEYWRPTERDLSDLNEFCLYELYHDRCVPMWIEHSEVRVTVANSVRRFFERGVGHLDSFVRTAMASQRDRALALPSVRKLTRCRFCLDEGCMTDLACHTTSVHTAKIIIRSGCILSASKARAMPGEVLSAESRNAAGDPADYFDYIMFSSGNCPAGDKLVYERNMGHVPSWEEFEKDFRPAVRFFFWNEDLIRHPDFCSDGYHTVKIHDELSLEPLLAAVVIPEELPGSSELLELARARMPESMVIARQFRGSGLKEWAKETYDMVRQCINR
jgi:hypothetical protein